MKASLAKLYKEIIFCGTTKEVTNWLNLCENILICIHFIFHFV